MILFKNNEDMKLRKLSLFLLIGIVCVSCKHEYTQNIKILQAESLLNTNPDSAYILLSSISRPEKMPKEDYAAWCLHYIHCKYKLYKPIENDSLINVAKKYYQRSNLLKYEGISFYLSGCISMSHHNNKKAIQELKQAEDLLERANEYNLNGLTEFNIGYLYMQDDLFKESLLYFKKALQNYIAAKDKKYQAYAYRAIADTYNQLNYPFGSVIRFTDLAIKLSLEAGDSINYYDNLCRKGELLYNRDLIGSTTYLLQSLKFLPYQKSKIASYLSYNYSRLNMQDSSKYYLNMTLSDTLSSNQIIQNLAAANNAKRENNANLVFHYLEKAYIIRDSITQKNILDQFYRIDKQYDLSKKEKENDELKISNRNEIILIGVLVLAVLVISIILLLLNRSYKTKQAAYALEKQRLEFEIKAKEIENDKKREVLLTKLQHKIENTLRFERLRLGVIEENKLENFINEMTKQSVFSDKERDYYIDEVNNLFDGKITRLSAKNPQLTKPDLIVITLISLQINITDSCILLSMNQNTMYVRRIRITKHIGLRSVTELENWVFQNVVKAC